MVKAIGAILLAGFIGAGCAAPAREEGFSDVQKDVKQRTGQRVRWNRQTDEDRLAAESVRSMLVHELTADRAVQIALLNNHRLQATYEEIGIAQADLVQAGLLKNPVFNAAVEIGDGGKGTKLQFSVLEDFISILQIPLRKRLAEAAIAQARYRADSAVVDLAGETRMVFYMAQASGQMLELRRTVAEANDAAYELAKRIRAAGNSTELELTTQEAQLAQGKLDLAAAEIQAQRDREHLTMLMGLNNSNWNIAPRLDDLPNVAIQITDIEERAVKQSLDLELAKADMQAAAETLGIAKAVGPFEGAQVGASAEHEVDGTWETGPAVSVPIPIFDTGKAQQAGARSRFVAARERYRAADIEVRSAARLAVKEVAAARARAEAYRTTIIPLRHKITDAMQTQYNAMLAGAFVLLDARRDEINAGAEYVAAQRDYWIAQTRLETLLAGRMNGVSP